MLKKNLEKYQFKKLMRIHGVEEGTEIKRKWSRHTI